jgi:hypothetical protein
VPFALRSALIFALSVLAPGPIPVDASTSCARENVPGSEQLSSSSETDIKHPFVDLSETKQSDLPQGDETNKWSFEETPFFTVASQVKDAYLKQKIPPPLAILCELHFKNLAKEMDSGNKSEHKIFTTQLVSQLVDQKLTQSHARKNELRNWRLQGLDKQRAQRAVREKQQRREQLLRQMQQINMIARQRELEAEERINRDEREWLKDEQARISLAERQRPISPRDKRIFTQSGRAETVLQGEYRRMMDAIYAHEQETEYMEVPRLDYREFSQTAQSPPPPRDAAQDNFNLLGPQNTYAPAQVSRAAPPTQAIDNAPPPTSSAAQERMSSVPPPTFGAAQLQHHEVQQNFDTQNATRPTHSYEKTSTPMDTNVHAHDAASYIEHDNNEAYAEDENRELKSLMLYQQQRRKNAVSGNTQHLQEMEKQEIEIVLQKHQDKRRKYNEWRRLTHDENMREINSRTNAVQELTFEQQFERNLQLAKEDVSRGRNGDAAQQHFAPPHAHANPPPPPPPNQNLPRQSPYDNPFNANQASSYNFQRGNGFLMSKIDVSTYRGKHDKRSPLEYLDLIKNKAISFNVDIFEVVKAKMPLALIEDAKMWWEMNEEFITSWDQFHQDFLNEFATPNFKRNLRRELELRTQHKDEDLTTFIHRIRRYYNLLGQSDNHGEIYERVKSQMHPNYRHYLSGKHIFDLRSLLTCAQQVQSEMHTDKHYAPPPGKNESVEKSLAFNDARKTRFVPSSNKSSDNQSTNNERKSRSESKSSSSQSRETSQHRSQSRERSGERSRSQSTGSQHGGSQHERSSSRDGGKRDGQHQRSHSNSKEKKRDATPHSSHRTSSKN